MSSAGPPGLRTAAGVGRGPCRASGTLRSEFARRLAGGNPAARSPRRTAGPRCCPCPPGRRPHDALLVVVAQRVRRRPLPRVRARVGTEADGHVASSTPAVAIAAAATTRRGAVRRSRTWQGEYDEVARSWSIMMETLCGSTCPPHLFTDCSRPPPATTIGRRDERPQSHPGAAAGHRGSSSSRPARCASMASFTGCRSPASRRPGTWVFTVPSVTNSWPAVTAFDSP
jgi:hypothetical protein